MILFNSANQITIIIPNHKEVDRWTLKGILNLTLKKKYSMLFYERGVNYMSRITLELTSLQIDELIEKLSMEEKLNIVEKLEKETLYQRWNEIFKDIDKRLKKFPISKKEIVSEIIAYRKEKNAKSYN